MRCALDVLAILTVVPKIQLQLAEPVDVLDEAGSTVSTVGKLNVVLIDRTVINCLLCVLWFGFCFFFQLVVATLRKRVKITYTKLSLGIQVNGRVDCS